MWILKILLSFFAIVGLIIIINKLKKRHFHSKSIGKKVRVEYYDHNDHFENILPIDGLILDQIKVGKRICHTIELTTDFEYKSRSYKNIVAVERHLGSYIGSEKVIHVHILLPKIELKKSEYSFKEFNHVVWAVLNPIN